MISQVVSLDLKSGQPDLKSGQEGQRAGLGQNSPGNIPCRNQSRCLDEHTPRLLELVFC